MIIIWFHRMLDRGAVKGGKVTVFVDKQLFYADNFILCRLVIV